MRKNWVRQWKATFSGVLKVVGEKSQLVKLALRVLHVEQLLKIAVPSVLMTKAHVISRFVDLRGSRM